MMPLPGRWLSSLVIRAEGEATLFDCGEGTQIAWRQAGWSFRRLGAICLSHHHADHVAGLPGLLHAVANADREEPVHIFGPTGTGRIVAALRTIAPVLPYAVEVTELDDGEALALPGGMVGQVAAGEHGLPSLAYRVDLARARRFLPDRARAIGVPQPLWRRLQDGDPVAWDGGEAEPGDVLGPPRRGVALAYVTDTRPVSALVPLVAGVDLLVCEGTYGDSANAAKAVERGHMTFAEAATLAAAGAVGHLWLTHFSPAVEEPEAFLANATAVFPRTTVGWSGLATTLAFPEEE
ncbi:MAG: ribonuclease Z [Chloroflexia bacterium]|nr:ribonuclease Z [Chloroflexia bacterium]